MDEKEKDLKCAECQKPIHYGGDLLKVERGVNGPRGIVVLGDPQTFCCEKCVSIYFNGAGLSGLPQLPPRIP